MPSINMIYICNQYPKLINNKTDEGNDKGYEFDYDDDYDDDDDNDDYDDHVKVNR